VKLYPAIPLNGVSAFGLTERTTRALSVSGAVDGSSIGTLVPSTWAGNGPLLPKKGPARKPGAGPSRRMSNAPNEEGSARSQPAAACRTRMTGARQNRTFCDPGHS
jgi:hypothetical protein